MTVGVKYQSSKIYSELNSEINKFNSMVKDYANLMNVKTINPNMLLVSNGTLNTYYTTDGYYLTNNGYKILYNNITNNVLTHLNSNSEIVNESSSENKNVLSEQRQLIINRAE